MSELFSVSASAALDTGAAAVLLPVPAQGDRLATFMRQVRAPNLIGRLGWKLHVLLGRRRLRKFGIVFGARTTINPSATFMDRGMVSFGTDCSVSGAVFVTHCGFDRIASKRLGRRIDSGRPIKVGNRCFIGASTTILGGVTIGDDCIIGAGAVVRKSVPSGSVVMGNPARVVCTTLQYLASLDRKYPSPPRR